jgi:hypothetical protein
MKSGELRPKTSKEKDQQALFGALEAFAPVGMKRMRIEN